MSQEKRAQNEAIFRAANERLKERLSNLESGGRIPFVCECGDADCLETVELSREAYEAIRRDDRRFFMLHGHEDASTEDVVGREDTYLVTEKHEGAVP
jgi:hypothetical protein